MSFVRKDRPFIIAEIGINHSGNFDAAEKMIRSAAQAGVDAIKFQTFIPELLYSQYTAGLMKDGDEGLPDMGIINFFKTFMLTEDDHIRLKKIADKENVMFLSAPFDIPSFELLERIGVSAYKVASSEITHTELLHKIAHTGKPVCVSTGMCHQDEIESAVQILKKGGCEIVLLHCVALYPVPENCINLSRIQTLSSIFGLPVGFSDHSPDIEYSVIAASLGASVIEKHFTLSRDFDCPDANVSVTPEQISELIKQSKRIYTMRGDGEISFGKEEEKLAKSARRSLFARVDIPEGKVLSESDIIAKRPGIGIRTAEISHILGKKAQRSIKADYLLRKSDFI